MFENATLKKIIVCVKTVTVIFPTFLLVNTSLFGQVQGCKDPLAKNYNPAATVNDGSCVYNITNYTPGIKVDPISDTLAEGSGLQMAGDFLWSLNDGGSAPAIYRIDTVTNLLLQKVILSGASNIDWEEIAFDGTHFYIGDFGNNANGARTDLKIYKFPFSSIPDYISNPVAIIPASQIGIINFSYSDQPKPPQPTSNNNTKFDCEAMFVDAGRIHLFTKNWIELITTHYVINSLTPGTHSAQPLETFATNYLVTGADMAKDQKIIALLGYQNNGSGRHYMHLLSDYTGGSYFNGNKRRIDLPDAFKMGQAEGICFRAGGYGYISSEKFVALFLTIRQKLRSFDIGNFVYLPATYIFIGNGNWNDADNWLDNRIPPTSISPGSEIIIKPVPGGQCILNISYTLKSGTKLTIKTAGSFIIPGNFIHK